MNLQSGVPQLLEGHVVQPAKIDNVFFTQGRGMGGVTGKPILNSAIHEENIIAGHKVILRRYFQTWVCG
jgi:hypothetical protein